jgi:hypothetical protein
MRCQTAVWGLLIILVWATYFVPIFMNNFTINNNNAATAVLSQITFAPQEEQALQTLLQVVSKQLKQDLHVELKEQLLTKSTTTTMVNILLWFRSAKEANEKKIILEENRPALELELQRTKNSLFNSVSVTGSRPRSPTRSGAARVFTEFFVGTTY